MSPKQTHQTPSLDSINDALSNWRENKANYPDKGIPDEIWLQIFQLEDNSSFSDGERLKIHTTTKRLDEVMRAFYNSQETD